MTVAHSNYLSDRAIRTGLAPFGVIPDLALCEKIRIYVRILLQWTEKISLTSIHSPLEIVERHFGESMFAASAVGIARGRLADVGSGAGFPGLALKLVRAELKVTLIEPNAKKAAFLSEVNRALKLTSVTVLRSRLEECREYSPSLDFITSRALDPTKGLIPWSHRALTVAGRLVLWVGDGAVQELSTSPEWIWQKPIAIPHSRRRSLLIGRPIK